MKSFIPSIELNNVSRWYESAIGRSVVLSHINLRIRTGEMVAIRGASGSGKSTLLHILGGLDFPSEGTYHLGGCALSSLSSEALAGMRGDNFGFIFQRYHLVSHLSALENICLPLSYAGYERKEARKRGLECLARVGLFDRAHYRPAQLSGGQQQRVAIARALVNGGGVILADEPTGALDRRNGQQIMDLLSELNAAGHTVVIVTHDSEVAARARRVIELEDGKIVYDSEEFCSSEMPSLPVFPRATNKPISRTFKRNLYDCLHDATRMVARVPLRSLLTMLGVAIGVAAVSSVVAVGQGARERVLKNIESLGPSVIEVASGKEQGDMQAQRQRPLSDADVALLRAQGPLFAVSPVATRQSAVAAADGTFLQMILLGVNETYPDISRRGLAEGAFFGSTDVASAAPVVVIDWDLRRRLFGTDENVIGRKINASGISLTVVGVEKSRTEAGGGGVVQGYVPYTALASRFAKASGMTIAGRVHENISSTDAQRAMLNLLDLTRGQRDFYVRSLEQIQLAVSRASRTFSLMIFAIAAVSLLVGGIGVMNMMLISVHERVHEIGLRMAVGARPKDIMFQFLTEASVFCAVGGFVGVVVSLGFVLILPIISLEIPVVFSWPSVVIGIVSATLIGLIFGYTPSRNASRMAPVQALVTE